MSILARILATKAEEISRGKAQVPYAEMLARARDCAPPRGFVQALLHPPQGASIALIAEIKRASPSKGLIREDFDPARLARAYAAGGAAALSVLTDQQYFQGADAYLRAARAACALPVLRKDFIIDPWQVAQARVLGADCILLIMAALEQAQAQDLAALARTLGMDVLAEVHNDEELDAALVLQTGLIGVNNRNLARFETTLAVSERLIPRLPADVCAVSESGIARPADIARIKAAGARAVLVGESLMRQDDVEQAVRALLGCAPS